MTSLLQVKGQEKDYKKAWKVFLVDEWMIKPVANERIQTMGDSKGRGQEHWQKPSECERSPQCQWKWGMTKIKITDSSQRNSLAEF